MQFYLLIIGFISILGQILILRELNVAFYGIDLIYIIAVGIWLLGTAAGAVTGKYFFYKSSKSLKLFFLAWAIILPLDAVFIRYIRIIFGGVTGAYLQFYSQIIAICIAVLPVSILLGVMFQHAAGGYIKGKNSLAKAYAVESIGGIAGGIISTLLLILGIQNLTAVFLCSLLSLMPALYYSFRDKEKYLVFISVVLIIIISAAISFSFSLNYILTKPQHPFLAESTDSPYGRITVTSYMGQVSVFENDALSFETESSASEEFVHLVVTQHPAPKSVLVLGGGIEGTVYELLKYKSIKIDYVELNKVLLNSVQKFLPDEIKNSLNSKRVNILVADARTYLSACGNYDIILVGMPEPSSGQSNRYYTKEFFELCSRHLNSNGIVGIRLKSAENLWTNAMIKRNSSIYKTLKSVFHDVVALPGSTCIITASNNTIEKNPEVLAERFKRRNISTKYIIPQYIKYIYTNDRYNQIGRILSAGNTQINFDIHPVSYQYTTAIWLSKFFPDINWFDSGTAFSFIKDHKIYIAAAALIFILFLIYIRYGTSSAGIVLVFLAGFSGMALETMSILYYQSVSGVLFQNIGLLLTSFMTGMAAGAAFINNLYHSKISKLVFRFAGLGFIMFLGILNFYSGYAVTLHQLSGLTENLILLFLTGFLVSGIFAFASFFNVKVHQDTISSLYSADLFGGCAASLLTSLILIPVLGMSGTGIMLGILTLCAVFLL